MRPTSRLLLGTIFAVFSACGSNAALPGINPSLALRFPTDNSTVSLSPTGEVAIGFDTNYTLRAPGTCAGQDNCGHVYLLVDNSSCNRANLPYNNLALSSPTFADLSRCKTPTGMHTVTLELHRDDGGLVETLVGNPVTAHVTFTAQ